MPKVSDEDLLFHFNRLCEAAGVVSRGFNCELITAPIDGEKHDGTEQWAMSFRPGVGWAVVSGWKGCGTALGGGADYLKKRKHFVIAIRMATRAIERAKEK